MVGRAVAKGLVEIEYIDLRKFGVGKHQVVDGRPFGGGPGMVLKADVLAKALSSIKRPEKSQVILMSASGKPYKQALATQFVKLRHLIIICGRYEGVDERFVKQYVDLEVSIGDYVLTGGELPAMVVADSVIRLLPGVLKKDEATIQESFTDPHLLEYPQYTHPQEFEGVKVPPVLLGGNHQKIEHWQKRCAKKKTLANRPDLL